jgi:spermidine synthase
MTNGERISDIQVVRFLVFSSGAAVMGVEILTSRLLAPYYGDTVYTWGSLIAIIMIALAIGYRHGGKEADKYASYVGLCNLVLIAGTFVALIPISAPFVLELVRDIDITPMYEPLLPSAILLTIPTIFMGMVSPYALRLVAKNIDDLGNISGGLSSLNTIGSIFGTFITVFFLIPNFGTRETILSIGVFLITISMIRRRQSYILGVTILLLIQIIPGNILFQGFLEVSNTGKIYNKETPYSSLSIVDNKAAGIRTLYLNNMPQSAMYLNGSVTPVYRYTDYFNLAFGYNPNITRVLFIGGGGFSGPKQFLVDYPDLSISVVEIDPEVVEAAHLYFQVPRSNPRLEISVMDGRKYLETGEVYDLIVLDAYSYTYVPFHLMTDEFMTLVNSHLSVNGVLVANVIGSLLGDTSKLLWSQVMTTQKNIPYVDLYKTKDTADGFVQNICVVASKKRVTPEKIQDNLLETSESRFLKFLEYKYDESIPEGGLVLYDNYAPVEDMLNPVTLTSYDLQGKLDLHNLLNPLIIGGLWLTSMSGIYYLTRRLHW